MPFALMKFACVHQSKDFQVLLLLLFVLEVGFNFLFVCENTKCEFICLYQKVFGRSSVSYNTDYTVLKLNAFVVPSIFYISL